MREQKNRGSWSGSKHRPLKDAPQVDDLVRSVVERDSYDKSRRRLLLQDAKDHISCPLTTERPRKSVQPIAKFLSGRRDTSLIASTFRQIASLAPGTWSTSHSVPRMCGWPRSRIARDQLLGATANLLLGHVGVRVERFRGQVAVEHDRWRHQVGVFPELPRAAQAEDRRLEPAGERPDHLRVSSPQSWKIRSASASRRTRTRRPLGSITSRSKIGEPALIWRGERNAVLAAGSQTSIARAPCSS